MKPQIGQRVIYRFATKSGEPLTAHQATVVRIVDDGDEPRVDLETSHEDGSTYECLNVSYGIAPGTWSETNAG